MNTLCESAVDPARSLGLRMLVAAVFVAAPVPMFGQADMPPVNERPNPYLTIEGWAKMPAGRTWGSTSAVDIDRDGRSVWVAERCGTNSCNGSKLPAILKFDSAGTLVASFGAGIMNFPHGVHVDREGNVAAGGDVEPRLALRVPGARRPDADGGHARSARGVPRRGAGEQPVAESRVIE